MERKENDMSTNTQTTNDTASRNMNGTEERTTTTHREPPKQEPQKNHRPSVRLSSEPTPVNHQKADAGLFKALGLRWTARWTERATEAQQRILHSRTQLVHQQSLLTEAHLHARCRLAEATRQAEEAEAEIEFQQTLREADSEEVQQIAEDELARQMLRLGRKLLRHPQNLLALHARPELTSFRWPTIEAAPPEPIGTLQTYISDEEIETLALQAVARLGPLKPTEAEETWEQWRQELRRCLPTYAAAEVMRRTEELKQRVRE